MGEEKKEENKRIPSWYDPKQKTRINSHGKLIITRSKNVTLRRKRIMDEMLSRL